MAIGQHNVVKPEKIAAAAVVAIGEESVLTKTVERRSFDEFKGAAGDKITFRVEGTLPVRSYEWRNDRSEQIVVDTYVEQTVDLTVEPNNDYSAVALIDEALEFDFAGAWGKLFNAQVKAVTGGLDRRVRKQVLDAPYERVMALVATSAAKSAAHADGEDLVFNFFSDVQAELKAMRNPDTNVVAVVGSGWANLLRKASKATKNQGTGDGAFASNVIDTFAGITAIEDPTLGKNEGYVYAASAILLFTAAPRIPLGAAKGAISNQNGYSLRWIQDYDASRQIDRSTFNSWIATGVTKDNLRQLNSDGTQEIVSQEQYFLRGIKIVLAADSAAATAAEVKPGDGGSAANGRKGAAATSDLAKVYNDQPFAGSLPAGDPFTIGHDVAVP